MKKCLHKNLGNKFTFDKKYGEPIKVEYTYCQDCGEIFKGSVKFIPKPKRKYTPKKKVLPIKKEKVLKKSSQIKPDKEILNQSKEVKVKITAKGTSSVTLGKPSDKKSSKGKAPKLKLKQDIKKAKASTVGKRKGAVDVPAGTSLGAILKGQFGIKPENKTTPQVDIKRKYKDIEEDALNEDDSDVKIFVK